MSPDVSPDSMVQRPDAGDRDGSPRTLFFVHIPKCAGTSVRRILRGWYGPDVLFFDSHEKTALRRAVLAHGTFPRAIAGHFMFGTHAALPCRPRFVSLVRDPLDRFVSLYRFVRARPDHRLHRAAADMGLEGFYAYTLRKAHPRGRTVGIQCYLLSGARTFAETLPVLDAHYDLVAPVERMQPFVNACARLLGRPTVVVESHNASTPDPETDAVKIAIAPSLREEHREDRLLYEHVRDTFERRLQAGRI